MRQPLIQGFAACLVFSTFGATSAAPAKFGRPGSKARVDLLSSVKAVAAGEAFDLGLRFRLADGWHIYWQNPGDSGLPPSVAWDLPEGFQAGPLRFPLPKRHVSAGGVIVTNVLEGEPLLLVRVTMPPDLPQGDVTLAANVTYLVCNETCLREHADVKVTLPVRRADSQPTPANQDVFKYALRAIPGSSSKHLKIKPSVDATDLGAGAKFNLVLTLDIAKGLHLQSHEPLQDYFVKTDVFLERVPGITYGKPQFPPGHLRKLPVLRRISEYSGRVTVRVPAVVDEDPPDGPVRLSGVLKYQACNSRGTCFPPDAVSFSLPVEGNTSTKTGAAPGANKPVAMTDHNPEDSSGDSDRHQDEKPADAVDQNAGALTIGGMPTPADGTSVHVGDTPTSAEKTSGRDSPEDQADRYDLSWLLLGCFLYGLFLNVTPCVLPLLSIKVLGFVQQAHESRARTLFLGLAFGGGVMIFFVVLGLLAATGKNMLQYPAAVIALGTVVMALALGMLGVYTLQSPATASNLEASIQQEGMMASFGKGALAPILGFACTGPMMATQFALATQQPPHIALLAFLITGFGMASPYILLGANPNWLSFLPKPGQWMITFERIMGFLLLGMVILLLHPLVTHIGAEGLEWTLVFLIVVAMACWVLGHVKITMPVATRWRYRGAAGGLVLVAGLAIFGWWFPLEQAVQRQRDIIASGSKGSNSDTHVAWRTWSAEAVEQEIRAGRTVFVDVTAAYCTNCKINKATAINKPETIAKLRSLDIAAFQADFTQGDPRIFELLEKHGRLGPPLDLLYPADRPDEPIILNTLFSLSYFLAKLDEAAAASQVASAVSQP